MKARPNYKFYPSLLDAYQDYLDTTPETFFYQDSFGQWHLNYSDGEYYYSDEEVEELSKQQLLDRINRVQVVSTAADKGTCFNEILDCIILNKKSGRDDVFIETVKGFDIKQEEGAVDDVGTPIYYDYGFKHFDIPCIHANMNETDFYFDVNFCKQAASHFDGSLCQVFTKAPIETKYGMVELYGYADYLRELTVFDAKTSRQYQFGKYEKKWQKHVYPYCFVTSGQCTEIREFEYTCFKLNGGSLNQPVISGQMFPEVYTFDYERSKEMLRKICERFIEFLIENKEEITDSKIFGN